MLGLAIAGALAIGCGSRGESARGAVGGAVGAAIHAGLDTSARERAPWRCGALDGPAPLPPATMAIGATAWSIDGRVARRQPGAGRSRPVAIAFVADAEAATPQTLTVLRAIQVKLGKLRVDAVVALGGMGDTAGELTAVYGALAGNWPLLAIPGDREPVAGLRAAIGDLGGRGVVDGTAVRWLVIGGVGVATVPGQPFAGRLAHGPDGCGHTDADVAALLAAPPDGLTFRILATQRAPRHTDAADRSALGAAAGDAGLAAVIAGKPGAPPPVDLVVHAALDGQPTPAGNVRPGAGPATIATGVASASPRIDGAGRRVTPAAVVVTVDAAGASWQVIAP